MKNLVFGLMAITGGILTLIFNKKIARGAPFQQEAMKRFPFLQRGLCLWSARVFCVLLSLLCISIGVLLLSGMLPAD